MTDVLHVQTRAYPLHYASLNLSLTSFVVPERGEVRLVPGTLGSLAYNPDRTVEVDLTDLIRPAVTLPGITIVRCHARALAAGAVLVSYLLRHARDLSDLDAQGLADLDAEVNGALRKADAPILAEVLAAAVEAGLFERLVLPPDLNETRDWTSIDPRSVRYNCHFVLPRPGWSPDSRVPDLVMGPRCRILLPYTYAWDADASGDDLGALLTMLEPADIAVAQQSILVDAIVGGRRILGGLARATTPLGLEGVTFRRFLDAVWTDYYQLDAYRVESGQGHRATYLAARDIIGLDGTHERAERLLNHVGASLLSESSVRSAQLDGRLNRVAAALAVVASASFLVDLAGFLIPEAGLGMRVATATGVILLGAGVLGATILSVRQRRGGSPLAVRQGRGRRH
ncbi:hypothetical protein ABNF97_13970 [Plantactinospora sp. B6F1]|uniref:hypothetical protein n=1 Tax=Plantactinospora sp. B6F1 TaxID=3158971 RepID=UPI00102C688B